ncbi:hypothetical protein, partial [uncultured Desulfovibrio sp.]|uniref:hypothetical protein n=1 Tax=uncultured Desulfovibrio sp. TaxID=167968 RepID=UPI00272A9A45
ETPFFAVFFVCYSLSGTVGATTLTTGQMPSHNHGVGSKAYFSSGSVREPRYPQASNECVSTYNGSSQPHTHSLAASTGAASTLPPYCSLAFVMRIA